MLVAKGYGNANPIASNDLLEGRFRNRRIEYHVVKAPTYGAWGFKPKRPPRGGRPILINVNSANRRQSCQ